MIPLNRVHRFGLFGLLLAWALVGCDPSGNGRNNAAPVPQPAELKLELDDIKTFHFSWPLVAGGSHYKLYQDTDGKDGPAGFQLIANRRASDATDNTLDVRHIAPLYAKATYLLSSCNRNDQCSDGQPLRIDDNPELNHLIDAIGYFKANSDERFEFFGASVSLSDDGKVMAVGAPGNNDTEAFSGAVYIFHYSEAEGWDYGQPVFVKASNPGDNDSFGEVVSLSGDGNYLAVGVKFEDGSGTGVNSPDDTSKQKSASGAVYIFHYQRNNDTWIQQAYIKASNAESNDRFGRSISLNDLGDVLAVGAPLEDSSAVDVNGNQGNDTDYSDSGAVYLYQRTEEGWQFHSYIKATNTDSDDLFGSSVSLSGDGRRLSVGATGEDSNGVGIDQGEPNNPIDQGNDTVINSGAVYLYQYSDANGWNNPIIYFKASNTGQDDNFGQSVSLSHNGTVLAVGAPSEESSALNVHPTSTDDDTTSKNSGAVYLFQESGNNVWKQTAYIKASNTGAGDAFGQNIYLSDNGKRIAIAALSNSLDLFASSDGEDSNSTGINGGDNNDEAIDAGAVYTYVFQNDQWQFESYVKASNTRGGKENVVGSSPSFGFSLSLSGDGDTLAVGASSESNDQTGITHGETEDTERVIHSGAVYLY